MENNNQLILWSLANRKKIGLKLVELKWVKDWLPGFTDFEASIDIDGVKCTGRGTGPTSEVALSKALSEALERFVQRENNIRHSNGMAAHTIYEFAANYAVNELVERDLFLGHHLSASPFFLQDLSIDRLLSRAVEALANKFCLEFVFVRTNDFGERKGLLCICYGHAAKIPFGAVVGLACDIDIKSAIMKSFIECIRDVSHIILGKDKIMPLSLSEFYGKSHYETSDHCKLALDFNYATAFRKSINIVDISEIKNVKDVEKINVRELFTSHKMLKNLPLRFAYAESQSLLQPVLGNFDTSFLPVDRIRVYNNKVKIDELRLLPHPLG